MVQKWRMNKRVLCRERGTEKKKCHVECNEEECFLMKVSKEGYLALDSLNRPISLEFRWIDQLIN